MATARTRRTGRNRRPNLVTEARRLRAEAGERSLDLQFTLQRLERGRREWQEADPEASSFRIFLRRSGLGTWALYSSFVRARELLSSDATIRHIGLDATLAVSLLAGTESVRAGVRAVRAWMQDHHNVQPNRSKVRCILARALDLPFPHGSRGPRTMREMTEELNQARRELAEFRRHEAGQSVGVSTGRAYAAVLLGYIERLERHAERLERLLERAGVAVPRRPARPEGIPARSTTEEAAASPA